MEPDFAPKLRPDLPECRSRKGHVSLSAATREFARQLRARFAEQIEHDPRTFRRHLVRFLKTELPLRVGRPCDAAVTRATKMRASREPWQLIYPVCIPEFRRLDAHARYLAQSRLRSAVRSRRNARRRRIKSRVKKVF